MTELQPTDSTKIGDGVNPDQPDTGKGKRDSTTVQSLIFDKKKFSKSEAIAWARNHNFKASKVDEKEDSYRLRQKDPGSFKEGSFRTITIADGVRAVVGRPKTEAKNLSSEKIFFSYKDKPYWKSVGKEGIEKVKGRMVYALLVGDKLKNLGNKTRMEAIVYAEGVAKRNRGRTVSLAVAVGSHKGQLLYKKVASFHNNVELSESTKLSYECELLSEEIKFKNNFIASDNPFVELSDTDLIAKHAKTHTYNKKKQHDLLVEEMRNRGMKHIWYNKLDEGCEVDK